MRQAWAYFFAMLFAALAPSLAHLLELPNKIVLSRDDYFTVQQINRGWALLGVVVFGAPAATLVLAVIVRRQRALLLWAIAAFIAIVAMQIVFWTFTFPTSRATNNWTVIPENWIALRSQWEYSHAAGAVLNLAAVVALMLSVLAWRGGARGNLGARGDAL